MMIELLQDDDAGFVDQVQSILRGCIAEYKPSEMYVVRVRDWFDYKWCYFSGKTLGAVPVSKFSDLTLPPFVPNRVISQLHYDRTDDGYKLSDAPRLHLRQPSEANFKRFVRRTTNDGALFWFSSGSKVSGRGSLMVYNVSPDIKFGWHVAFLKKAEWQIEKVTFTSKPVVEALRTLGRNQVRQAHGLSADPVC